MASSVPALLSFGVVICHLFVCAYADTSSKDYMKKEHSLIKPFHSPYWDFTGSTVITSQQCRLTADTQSQGGSLWNTVPVTAHNWEVHVQFKVHGHGSENLHGDGMALWYSKEKLKPGPVFGNQDYFTGLAIFLDTYSNHNGPHNHGHPYVSAMVNNGSLHYDHDRDGTHTEVAGCPSKFRNKPHDTFIAIRYKDNTLKVSLDVENKDAWEECFTVSNVRLPTGFYLGASAATGDLSDNHDVISLKFYELESSGNPADYNSVEPSASVFASPRDHIDDPKRGFLSDFGIWKAICLFILLVVAVGIVAVVGFMVVTRQQQGSSSKRFY